MPLQSMSAVLCKRALHVIRVLHNGCLYPVMFCLAKTVYISRFHYSLISAYSLIRRDVKGLEGQFRRRRDREHEI